MDHTRLNFWLYFWSMGLSLAWLVPNHYPPWLAFFSDAWVSALVLIAAAAVLGMRKVLAVHRLALLTLLVSVIPWLQYATGMLPSIGFAWIYFLFVLAFAMAQIIGAQAEKIAPGALSNALFFAVGLAALVSVGLQIYQWLEGSHLGWLVIWDASSRPSGNLGQANQLATLHLWGLIAVLWALERGFLHGPIAALTAAMLLIGIALTGSRAAWLGLFVIAAFIFLQHQRWRYRKLPWAVIGLLIYFAFLVVLKTLWNPFFDAQSITGDIARDDGRLGIWLALIDAVSMQPLLGYGIGQVAKAQMVVALSHDYVPAVFSYAHNIVLDTMIWVGVPLGVLLVSGWSVWLINTYKKLDSAQDSTLFLVLLVLCNHALFEMPLYYAYFLLPFGLFIGVLQARTRATTVLALRPWLTLLPLMLCVGLWIALLRDYARVEGAYNRIQLEWQNIQLDTPFVSPDLTLLTQWTSYFDAMHTKPQTGMTEEELDALKQTLVVHPTMRSYELLSRSLVLNGREQEARDWLKRACKTGNCTTLKAVWAYYHAHDPNYAGVPWPVD